MCFTGWKLRIAARVCLQFALLKYEKTDRPPYPWLYALYAGDIKPEQVYEKIEETGFPERYKERVLFHAQLYVGIFHELHGREKEALKHLDAAAALALSGYVLDGRAMEVRYDRGARSDE